MNRFKKLQDASQIGGWEEHFRQNITTDQGDLTTTFYDHMCQRKVDGDSVTICLCTTDVSFKQSETRSSND